MEFLCGERRSRGVKDRVAILKHGEDENTALEDNDSERACRNRRTQITIKDGTNLLSSHFKY